jgi:transcriptional regulator with XRE-family HTH domain
MATKFESQGLALRKFRKENGMTIQEVVNKLGHASMWLSDIENGKKISFLKMQRPSVKYTVILLMNYLI